MQKRVERDLEGCTASFWVYGNHTNGIPRTSFYHRSMNTLSPYDEEQHAQDGLVEKLQRKDDPGKCI